MASFRSICRFCRGLQKRWETSGNICDVSATSVVKQACTGGSVFDRELRTSPLSTGKDGYTLPWPQYSKPFALREPIWNRQAGLFLLRRVANMLGEQFSVSDFLLGVKDAVYVLADTIAHQSKHEQLRRLLEPTLYSAVEESLTSLPTNAHIHLDIESIRNLQLVCVNGIIGTADPGDEHVIGWLGQKVITSEAKLQELVKEDSKFTFDRARGIGRDAVATRLEFQLGVSFSTKEKFAVLDEGSRLVEGSNQFRDCFHFWKLSTLVEWETDEFPFQWSIADINNHVQYKVK